MWELFGIGFMAGLALAIPVGPMAIMLINTTISKGLKHGVVGALGMATVDGAYAMAVFVIGSWLSTAIASSKLLFGVIGALILMVLGLQTSIRNIRLLNNKVDLKPAESSTASVLGTYGTFIGATVVNPPTALYFLAIAPNVANLGYSLNPTTVTVFALSVLVGSLVWQEALVLAGLSIRSITTNRVRAWIGLTGGLLIIGLAISVLVKAL